MIPPGNGFYGKDHEAMARRQNIFCRRGAIGYFCDAVKSRLSHFFTNSRNPPHQHDADRGTHESTDLATEAWTSRKTGVDTESLTTAIECAGEAVFITDASGMILYANPAFTTQTGYARKEVLGKTPNILKSGLQDAAFYANLWATIRSGKTWRGELANRRKDGVLYEVEQTIAPGKDGSDAITGYVSIKRDVTERRRAEREVAEHQSRMQASARMAALGLVAGNIAHEIKNPLTVISGDAELLATMCRNGKGHEKNCLDATERIARNAERLERIVRGLLNLSREGARDTFHCVSMRTLIEETAELCRPQFVFKGVRLECPMPGADLRVECRPTQISQALLNLLTNALDAVSPLQQRWVRVECFDDDDAVVLAVIDSGGGIAAPLRANIFNEFYTTKNDGASCGLGLSISRAIVEQHDGVLFLDEDAPHTRFVSRLPKTQAKSRKSNPSEAHAR